MREIKFRAWHRNRKTFLDFYWAVDKLGRTFSILDKYVYDEFTDEIELMQYTGLKDVNGVEIYEGDIVQPVRPETLQEINSPLIVETANYVSGKWIARNVASESYGVEDYYFKNELSVIGNKFQNPELLEAD